MSATINYSVAGTATINWTDPTNPGTYNGSADTITGYNVWTMAPSTSGAYVADGTCFGATITSCLITNLTPDETWTFELTTQTVNDQTSSDSSPSNSILLPSASTISLNSVSNATYNTEVTLTATSNTPGNVDFTINGFGISGCSSVTTTASSPYTATCPWTPGAPSVSASIGASFTPQYSLSYTDAATSESVVVSPGTPTVSLTGYTGAVYGTAASVQYTTNVSGAVEFESGGTDIAGCSSVATTGSGPYTATCQWTPSVVGATTFEAVFTSYDIYYSGADTGVLSTSVAQAAQPSLNVTSTSGSVSTPLDLTSSGGEGVNVVTYSVVDGTASGCTVSVSTPYVLTATSAGTCVVTATEAGDIDYLTATSTPTVVTLTALAQPALSVTSTRGTVSAPLDLTSSGGEGVNAVTYSVVDGTASGCAVSVSTPYVLTATSAGTCVVTATELGDTDYLTATSAPTVVTLTNLVSIHQSTLMVSSTSGDAGAPLTLATSGGEGDGAVTYSVVDGTASGCAVSVSTPYVLTATSAGTCVVTATKAGAGSFQAAVSSPTTVTFAPITNARLVVDATSGSVGTRLKLATAGGNGTGAVTYSVVDGTASGCAVSVSTPYVLTATSAGTCVVTATQASDGLHASTTSSPLTLTLEPVIVAARVTSLSSTVYDVSLTQRGLSPGARVVSNAPGVSPSVAANSLRVFGIHLRLSTHARPGTYLLRVIDRNGTSVSVHLKLILVGGTTKIVPRIAIKT